MDEIDTSIEKGKEFIRNRITELRIRANVSEYQMSFELGKSRSYIQEISAGKAMPSMAGFLNICDYFEITPLEFFDANVKSPSLLKSIDKNLRKMSEADLKLFEELSARFTEKQTAGETE